MRGLHGGDRQVQASAELSEDRLTAAEFEVAQQHSLLPKILRPLYSVRDGFPPYAVLEKSTSMGSISHAYGTAISRLSRCSLRMASYQMSSRSPVHSALDQAYRAGVELVLEAADLYPLLAVKNARAWFHFALVFFHNGTRSQDALYLPGEHVWMNLPGGVRRPTVVDEHGLGP